MIRLSIPLRQALARLSLPVLIALAFGTMLLGKADAVLAERARMALADLLTPIWGALQSRWRRCGISSRKPRPC